MDTNYSNVEVPLIVSDMDGVLVILHKIIPGVVDAMNNRIFKNLEDINPKKYAGIKQSVPFMILTNRGGVIEKNEIQSFN